MMQQKNCLTDTEIINNQNSATLHTHIGKCVRNYLREAGNGERRRFLLLGHNFLSTKVMSIIMCFWVEFYMFFVLHDYIFVLIVRHSPTFPYKGGGQAGAIPFAPPPPLGPILKN